MGNEREKKQTLLPKKKKRKKEKTGQIIHNGNGHFYGNNRCATTICFISFDAEDDYIYIYISLSGSSRAGGAGKRPPVIFRSGRRVFRNKIIRRGSIFGRRRYTLMFILYACTTTIIINNNEIHRVVYLE